MRKKRREDHLKDIDIDRDDSGCMIPIVIFLGFALTFIYYLKV